MEFCYLLTEKENTIIDIINKSSVVNKDGKSIPLSAITKIGGDWDESTPWCLVPKIQDKYPEIDQMTRISYRKFNLQVGERNSNEKGGLVDSAFFEMFSFPFVDGGVLENFDTSRSVVITERLAKKLLLTGDPVGQSIDINNGEKFIISGIIKNVPQNSHLQFDFLVPCRRFRENADSDWSYDCSSYLTLKSKLNLDNFQKKIADFIMDNDSMDWQVSLKVQPFRRIHLYSLNGTGPIMYIYIFMGLAFLILFIASIN